MSRGRAPTTPRSPSTPSSTRSTRSKGSPSTSTTSPSASSSLGSPVVASPPAARPAQHHIGELRAVVEASRKQLRKVNTSLAYDPKVKEYKAFCDHAFSFNDPCVRYTVNADSLYRFLFYHVFRNKKSSKGKKRGTQSTFDAPEYDRVMAFYTARVCTVEHEDGRVVSTDVPDPENPVGGDTITTYRSSVKSLYDEQCDHGANGHRWPEINTPSVLKLMSIVKGRNKRVKKKNYAEKIEDASSPFHSYGQIGEIERSFWLKGCSAAGSVSSRTTFCALRNRFNLLMNFAAILRNESITLSELSDCRHFVVQRIEDHDPMLVFLLIIATGKTILSSSSSQYGRATRHKDVFQCAVGALGFYLLERFHVTGEFEDHNRPDFRENKEWFDIKVLVKQGENTKKEMTQRPFAESVDKIFQELGIHSNHQGHFGRVTAPVYAEFKELPPEMIKILGKFFGLLFCLLVFLF
jgi:hypothetical protein